MALIPHECVSCIEFVPFIARTDCFELSRDPLPFFESDMRVHCAHRDGCITRLDSVEMLSGPKQG